MKKYRVTVNGTVYEVELEDRSGTEYEYRIDAYTGAVLEYDMEQDD